MKVHWVYKDEIVDCDDYWAVLSLYETKEEGFVKGWLCHDEEESINFLVKHFSSSIEALEM